MIVSERNLKQVCEFLVSEYRAGRSNYQDARKAFRGLSLLLVGCREKQHIQQALDTIDNHHAQAQKKGAAHA